MDDRETDRASKLRKAIMGSKWLRRSINLLIPLVLILVLLLPPISLWERVTTLGYSTVAEDGGSISGPEGIQLTVPPGSKGLKVRITSTPRLKFLEETSIAIPQNLMMKSALYEFYVRGGPPSAVALTIPLPGDAEPLETLDLYAWDGQTWRWLPSHPTPEGDQIVANLASIPPSVAVMQTRPIAPIVSAELALEGSLSPEGQGILTEVNTQGFFLKDDGTIGGEISEPLGPGSACILLPALRNQANEGIVRSDWTNNTLANGELRERHTAAIVRLVIQNMYPGIDIDYRGIDPDLREEFTLFITALAEQLHDSGKLLTVRVEPPVRISEGRWGTGAYDWRAVGRVADALRIPAIPDPEAYAPGGRMEALLRYAVGEVNRYKIRLLLPTSCYDILGDEVTERLYAEALELVSCDIAVREGGQTFSPGQRVTLELPRLRGSRGINLDEEVGAYWYTYVDEKGAEHTLWLENAASIAHKLELAARFNLGGVAFQDLLEEGNDEHIWEVVAEFQEATVPRVAIQFALVWTVESATGEKLHERTGSFDNPLFVWRAPREPGEYIVAASISADGGRTTSARGGRITLQVPTPTPTPTPIPTATPTPQPTPTPEPTPKVMAAAAAPPPAPAPSGTGFDYGVQVHMFDRDHAPIINAIKGMGFRWIKQQIEWFRFEPAKGQYKWSQTDRLVNSCSAAGLKVLLSVVKAPRWARPPHTDFSVEGPPANPQDLADFLGAMSARYCGRVQAIEVWNEQNINYEWGNEPPDPARYVQLLAASYNAMKCACPQMIVVSGALTPAGDVTIGGQWRAVDDVNYLDAMYQHGLKDHCDAVGAHPSGYNVPPDADWMTWSDPTASFRGPSDNPHHSWVFRGTMEGYRNVMLKYGDGSKRIWPTEFGWASVENLAPEPAPGYEYASDNTEAEQAQYLAKAYQMGKSWGWVGPMFLWNLNFAPACGAHDEKAAFSILYPDWSPRPSYAALRDMPK